MTATQVRREPRTVRGRRPSGARQRTNPQRRRASLRRRWIAALTVLAVAGAGYLVGFTSLLGVSSVEVVGTDRVSVERVLERAGIRTGHPMVRIDTSTAERRIGELLAVEQVTVSRSLPSTVVITVTERTPVAYITAGDDYLLVDGYGVPFHEVEKKPKKVPRLKLADVAPDDALTVAVTSVLIGLPADLAGQVKSATAQTQGSIELTLADGKLVRWGSADRTERKAAVLAALLTQPGEIYDVSSPELPTVS